MEALWQRKVPRTMTVRGTPLLVRLAAAAISESQVRRVRPIAQPLFVSWRDVAPQVVRIARRQIEHSSTHLWEGRMKGIRVTSDPLHDLALPKSGHHVECC